MAAYLRFYRFESSPFESAAAKRRMVLGTQSLRSAFGHVKQGLAEGSPRVCLSGSGGVGKTSFCRALPKLLASTAQVVVVLDPRRPWEEIRTTIAKKFNLDGGVISRTALMAARESSKQLVLVIDQAEALSHESLDHLDILLQYKCDEDKQLLHCVMLANLDAASTGAEIPLLWWLDRFTTLQLQFSPIPVEGLRHYVEKHLAKAGWAGGELFTKGALAAIHRNTGGVPRAVNELCEKILIEGGARAITSITDEFIEELCGDSRRHHTPKQEAASQKLSPDWSFGDSSTSPTAQEMLDATSPEMTPPADVEIEIEIEANRERLLENTQDIATLLVTQDSPEPLRVASETPVRETSSSNLELEDHPGDTSEAYEDSFYGHTSSVGAATTMTRSPTGTQSRRGSGRMVVGLMALALIAGAIYSQFSRSTKLVESAEVEIAETLEQQTGTAPARRVEPTRDSPKESSLPPSILDRADELAANSALKLASPPATQPEAGNDPARASEVAASPEPDTQGTSRGAGSRSSRPLSTTRATTPMTTPSSTDVAKSETGSAAESTTISTTTAHKPPTSFSDELLVINEYTAIPEAAASAPKLPLPLPIEVDSDRNPSQPTHPPARVEAARRSASEPPSAPPTPARIAPDAKSDAQHPKLGPADAAIREEAETEPAKSPEANTSTAR